MSITVTIHRNLKDHPMHQYGHDAYERKYACTGCGIHARQFGSNWPIQVRAEDGAWVDTPEFPTCNEKGSLLIEKAQAAWGQGEVAKVPEDINLPVNF